MSDDDKLWPPEREADFALCTDCDRLDSTTAPLDVWSIPGGRGSGYCADCPPPGYTLRKPAPEPAAPRPFAVGDRVRVKGGSNPQGQGTVAHVWGDGHVGVTLEGQDLGVMAYSTRELEHITESETPTAHATSADGETQQVAAKEDDDMPLTSTATTPTGYEPPSVKEAQAILKAA